MAEKLSCYVCGNVGFECANGFYYCTRCNTQAEDIAETGIDDDFMDTVGPGAIYSKTNRQSTHVSIKTEPVTLLSQTQPENSQIWRTLLGTDEDNPKKGDNDCEPCGPEDFGGTSENFPFDPVIFAAEIRIRYIQGLQLMTQSQCQVLLEKFGVSPLISGVVAMIWLRYIAVSRVFDEKWADETFEDSEIQKEEYSKDFRTYLSYCKDVVFSGLEPILEDNKEEKIIEELWDIFEKEDPEAEVRCTRWSGQEESKDEGQSTENGCSFSNNDDVTKQHIDVESPGSASVEILKDGALRRMKLNMEENGFLYIPPRVKLKRFDYLHYVRKNDDGSRCYVAHADYYILLRACARVAQVNVRYMHAAVLKLEKRLAWMENRIDQSVHWTVQTPTESNSDVEQILDKNDSLDFSNYNFVM